MYVKIYKLNISGVHKRFMRALRPNFGGPHPTLISHKFAQAEAINKEYKMQKDLLISTTLKLHFFYTN